MSKKYPTWKKVLWQAGRAFFQAFIASFSLVLIGADGLEIIKDGASVSFANFLYNLWAVIFYPAILSGIAAGIAAIGKFLREKYGKKDYTKSVYKLPI